MANKKQNKRKHRMDKNKTKKSMERGHTGGTGSSYATLTDGLEWFKPAYAEGKTTAIYHLNVIPFVAGKNNAESDEGDLYFRSRFRMGRVGANGDKVISPSTFGQACPMTDLYFEMKDNPDIPKKELDKLGTKQRELYYVVDCKDKNKQIRVLDFSSFLFGKILDEEMESEEYEEEGFDAVMFADPVEGRTLKVVFKEDSFMNNAYSKVSKMSFVERKGKVTDEMIDSLEDPLTLLDRKSTKQVQAMLDDNDVDGGSSTEEGELEDMTRSELKLYIKENDLDIKVAKSMDDDDIRDAIQEAMDGSDSDDDDDDIPMDYDDEDPEDEEESSLSVADDIEDLNRKELKAYIKEYEFDIKVTKSMDEDDIKEAILESSSDDDEDEDDEDEDDDEDFMD